MAKKRERHQNPQPFLATDDDSIASARTRFKAPKHHQKQEKLIASGMSSKILKETLIQQKEFEEESERRSPNSVFVVAEEESRKCGGEEDIDDFGGFSQAGLFSLSVRAGWVGPYNI